MVEFQAVHISPKKDEKKGLYFYRRYEDRNGERKCEVSPIGEFAREMGYKVLPLGVHSFGDIERMRAVLEYGCRFVAPERGIVKPPETTRLDLDESQRDYCIELRAPNLNAICSISPLSRHEAKEVVFSLAACASEKNR